MLCVSFCLHSIAMAAACSQHAIAIAIAIASPLQQQKKLFFRSEPSNVFFSNTTTPLPPLRLPRLCQVPQFPLDLFITHASFSLLQPTFLPRPLLLSCSLSFFFAAFFWTFLQFLRRFSSCLVCWKGFNFLSCIIFFFLSR